MKWFLDFRKHILSLCMLGFFPSCGSYITYYDVNGTQSTKCSIQGSSTICDEGHLAFTMTLGIEELEDHILIYWDDSTWEGEKVEGNIFRAFRYHEIQDSKEACHTAQSEILELDFGEDSVEGIWQRESRTEGPQVCGDTPTGAKDEITLSGYRVQSL